MPERNVIGGMDRVGITMLEDAFDAKPMYDTLDEATNRSAVLGPCAQHGARYMAAAGGSKAIDHLAQIKVKSP